MSRKRRDDHIENKYDNDHDFKQINNNKSYELMITLINEMETDILVFCPTI